MACGDKYSHLLRASGERTVDSPFSTWCNEPDAEAWYGQATYVKKLQREAWNALMRIENEKGVYPETAKLRAPSDAYEANYDGLPQPSAWMAFGMGGCAEAIQEMIGNIRQGACVLEKLNDALVAYGSGAIDPGAVKNGAPSSSWVPGALGGLALLGVGGTIAYYVWWRPTPPSTTLVIASGRNGNGNANANGAR